MQKTLFTAIINVLTISALGQIAAGLSKDLRAEETLPIPCELENKVGILHVYSEDWKSIKRLEVRIHGVVSSDQKSILSFQAIDCSKDQSFKGEAKTQAPVYSAPQVYDLTIDKCSFRYRLEPNSLVCINHKHETLPPREIKARQAIAEQKRKEEEAIRLAEQKRKEDEAVRLAEQKRKEDEAIRLAEQKRKEDEAVRLAEQKRKEDEAIRLAEQKRKEDEAIRLAEQKRKEDEAIRLAEKNEEAARELLAKERLEKAEQMIAEARKQAAEQLEGDKNSASDNYLDGLRESVIENAPEIIFEIGKMLISSMFNMPQTKTPEARVKGYTRKNGTKVAPYTRSAPKK